MFRRVNLAGDSDCAVFVQFQLIYLPLKVDVYRAKTTVTIFMNPNICKSAGAQRPTTTLTFVLGLYLVDHLHRDVREVNLLHLWLARLAGKRLLSRPSLLKCIVAHIHCCVSKCGGPSLFPLSSCLKAGLLCHQGSNREIRFISSVNLAS